MIDHYEPDIVTAQDYYPFGMLSRVSLPNSGKSYKFGFNGKMNDDEVKGGLGNQQDYGMRISDPRIGRFLSVDPITSQYPELTPYQFASNTPIRAIDLDGLEAADALSLKIKESISIRKVPNTMSMRVYHNYNGAISSTGLNFDQSNINMGFRQIFKKEPNTSLVESAIVPNGGGEDGINNLFSMAIATRDKIPENFADISIAGLGNTFRHFLMQTVMTSAFGADKAKQFGDLKELHDMPLFSNFKLDAKVDLINNMYGRQYAIMNKISLSDFLTSEEASANILNDISVHILKSIDEYKNNPAYQDIISGKVKIFEANTLEVSAFRYNLGTLRSLNEKFLTKEERRRNPPKIEDRSMELSEKRKQ